MPHAMGGSSGSFGMAKSPVACCVAAAIICGRQNKSTMDTMMKKDLSPCSWNEPGWKGAVKGSRRYLRRNKWGHLRATPQERMTLNNDACMNDESSSEQQHQKVPSVLSPGYRIGVTMQAADSRAPRAFGLPTAALPRRNVQYPALARRATPAKSPSRSSARVGKAASDEEPRIKHGKHGLPCAAQSAKSNKNWFYFFRS